MSRAPKQTTVDPHADETVTVMLPSGSMWEVFPREVAFFNERANKYRKEYALANISDLAELDRVLQFETLCHRYMTWEANNCDYWNEPAPNSVTSDLIKRYSTEVRMVKQALGIDKVTRDKTQGDDSVATRWADVVKRAGEFKVLRNSQFDMALELINELMAKVILADRSNDDERKMLEVRDADIIDWIRNFLTPKYRKIDEEFRRTQQKMWVEDINR